MLPKTLPVGVVSLRGRRAGVRIRDFPVGGNVPG